MGINRLTHLLLGLLLIFFLFNSCSGTQLKADSKPPVITHSFAVEKGYYGYTWKFYIEAEDPDGDMDRIVALAHQPGYGTYANILPIVLKPQFRSHFKGYIQWNSFSSRATRIPEWTEITIRISVIDKARNESNEVVFPITFESGARPKYELPAPFDRGDLPRLGFLNLDLVNPFSDTNALREPF